MQRQHRRQPPAGVLQRADLRLGDQAVGVHAGERGDGVGELALQRARLGLCRCRRLAAEERAQARQQAALLRSAGALREERVDVAQVDALELLLRLDLGRLLDALGRGERRRLPAHRAWHLWPHVHRAHGALPWTICRTSGERAARARAASRSAAAAARFAAPCSSARSKSARATSGSVFGRSASRKRASVARWPHRAGRRRAAPPRSAGGAAARSGPAPSTP